MADYHLLTIWRIDAPLSQLYEAIHDSMHWPEWWSGSKKVEQTADGDGNGINNVRRYSWQGNLPYCLVFELRATRIESLVAIEGSAEGDLEGTGCWQFSHADKVSVVSFEWHVRSTRWWMNILAPLARPIFIRNHAQIMAWGGERLARRFGATLLSLENIDLTTGDGIPKIMSSRLRNHGRISPLVLVIVGIGTGVLATVVQALLWWLNGMPVLETLCRDAGLTAAMLVGPSILQSPSTATWDILLLASLIHFVLSITYTIVPAILAACLPIGSTIIAGALYGLGIYMINMYGFTAIFPWFAIARDWITLLTHLVFGVGLTTGCWWLTKYYTKARPKVRQDERTP